MRENKKNCGNLYWIKIYLETSSKLKDILETIIRKNSDQKQNNYCDNGKNNKNNGDDV